MNLYLIMNMDIGDCVPQWVASCRQPTEEPQQQQQLHQLHLQIEWIG